MSDFTVQVHTDSNHITIDLPPGRGPGDYKVVVSPATQAPVSQALHPAGMNDVQRRFYELALELNLKPDLNYRFDREEANSRK